MAHTPELPILARWGESIASDEPDAEGLSLTLDPSLDPRGKTSFTADFEHDEDGRRVAAFLNLFVDPSLRRQGYAGRLIGTMTHLAVSRGVEYFHGSVESEHVLQAFGRAIGEDRIRFTDVDPTSEDYVTLELPITFGQAVLSLQCAGTYEESLEERDNGIVVLIDLTGLSPDAYEAPRVLTPPPGTLDWQ